MSYTLVEDNGVYHVRASIDTSGEMRELIGKLENKLAVLFEKENAATAMEKTNEG